MENSKLNVLAAVGLVVGLFAGASTLRGDAEILLEDTFNNTQPSSAYGGNPPGSGDYGVNQELSIRQAGTVVVAAGPVSYNRRTSIAHGGPSNTQVNHTQVPGALGFAVNDHHNPYVILKRNFTPDVDLSVTIDPVVDDAGSPNWTSISLRGQTDAHAGFTVPLSPTSGVSLLAKSDGSWAILTNGAFAREQDVIRGQVAAAAAYEVALRVEGNQLSGTINGVSLLTGTRDGQPIEGITLDGPAAGEDNYIAISAYTAPYGERELGLKEWHSVENLRIGQVGSFTPEPMTLLLLAAGTAGLLLRRRRRCVECGTKFTIPLPPSASGDSTTAPEDTIIRWLADGSGPPAPAGTKAPVRPAAVPRKRFAVALLSLDPDSAVFRFDPEFLYDEGFRVSLPRRCVGCGSRKDLQVRLADWSYGDEGQPQFGSQPDAPAFGLKLAKHTDLHDRALLAGLPRVAGLPEPYCLPFPYYVCHDCYSDDAITATLRPTPGGEGDVCELGISSLLHAEMFAAVVRGPDDPARQRIRIVRKGQEADTWHRLPKLARVRIERWYQPEESEKFIAYFPDADYSAAGLAGVVVTDRRLVFRKNVASTTMALKDVSRVSPMRSGAQVTVDVLPTQGKVIRLQAQPSHASEFQKLVEDLVLRARPQ